jgi:hypothetical protein
MKTALAHTRLRSIPLALSLVRRLRQRGSIFTRQNKSFLLVLTAILLDGSAEKEEILALSMHTHAAPPCVCRRLTAPEFAPND